MIRDLVSGLKRFMYSTRAATLLMRAMLFACAFYGGFGLAMAVPIAASTEAARAMSKMSPAAPAIGRLNDTPAIFAETAVPIAPRPGAKQPAIEPHGRAYLFRGALGPIFSRGMDRLSERIERAGVTASVYEFTICGSTAEKAIWAYRQDPAPITLIGHSMGGFCALKFAEMLQAADIPVGLVVTVDPAHVSPNVPLNVERYINIFLSNGVLGGGDVLPKQGYQGHYASFDLSQHEDVTHINIDKMDSIHDQLVTKIRQLVTTPSNAEGKAVPLRYVVPPNTGIELWDSGMAVLARSRDTLQTLAAFHRVPLWSLTQINEGADSAPLAPGQRVIVPRHLLPLAVTPRQSPSKR
jgi:hypothetical protein